MSPKMNLIADKMTKEFYDQFEPYYHLIFPNWEKSVKRQGDCLHDLIQSTWGNNTESILDVSCGIGTQSIGLAKNGYNVHASDISPKEIERAKNESKRQKVQVKYSVADMRKSFQHHQREFDLLISCDNSVPHLLSDAEILSAFKEFYNCINVGGGCLLTIRDYEKEEKNGIQIKPYSVTVHDGVKHIIFQTWEFSGDIYDLSMYLTVDDGNSEPKTTVFRTKYYAVSTSKIISLLGEAGFQDVGEAECDYYQPVIIGTKKT